MEVDSENGDADRLVIYNLKRAVTGRDTVTTGEKECCGMA